MIISKTAIVTVIELVSKPLTGSLSVCPSVSHTNTRSVHAMLLGGGDALPNRIQQQATSKLDKPFSPCQRIFPVMLSAIRSELVDM